MTRLPRTFLGVLALLALAPAVTLAQTDTAFADEVLAFATADAREGLPPANAVLFTGSSSIRLWQTLGEDFAGTAVINRGFGGSQIKHLIQYFDRIVRPYAPRRIIVYSATNDISAGRSVDEVMADWATFCGMVRGALPGTSIALISIAPNPARWAQREAQQAFNARAAAYNARQGHDFIDVWTPMLGDDGLPSRDIYVADQLHMNAAGYEMWRGIVGAHLE